MEGGHPGRGRVGLKLWAWVWERSNSKRRELCRESWEGQWGQQMKMLDLCPVDNGRTPQRCLGNRLMWS